VNPESWRTPWAAPAWPDQILSRTGVKAFLANRWVVGDAGAATFAISLYQTLAQGKTLGVAVREARKKLYAASDKRLGELWRSMDRLRLG